MARGDSIDYEGIRETLLELGDDLYSLGFPWFLDGLEGNNRIGRALQNPRSKDEILLLRAYMISAARVLKKLNAARPSDAHVTQAMTRLDAAWHQFLLCLDGV